MTNLLLENLCDPYTKEPLELINPEYDDCGRIISGDLRNPAGSIYPVINGIPRFVDVAIKKSVDSFGDQWNYFNFDRFKLNWLNHTVKNTFGTPEYFKDKIIVDAGGGSGMQTRWMLECGARHVIMLDLSHSVEDVVQRNLQSTGFVNYDVVQCSIDAPPLRSNSIEGLVICHNVIQHTPSVEKTARALFDIVKSESAFAFNCYRRNNRTLLKRLIFRLHESIRAVLSTMSFPVRLGYARAMGLLRFIPLLGLFLEKTNICIQGDVPRGSDSTLSYLRRCYSATVLNTFDHYGAHAFQHYKTDEELKSLLAELQPDRSKIGNLDAYFSVPQPIGCALVVTK